MSLPTFAAIDFETADHGSDSACAVGVVLVRDGRIADRFAAFIRPPRPQILFSAIHGLTWAMLQGQPAFDAVWPQALARLAPAEFLVAHNAPFDRRVLYGCCDAHGLARPPQSVYCTCRLSRQVWPGSRSYRLPDICRRVGVPLVRHHDAAADAEACACLMCALLEARPEIVSSRQNRPA